MKATGKVASFHVGVLYIKLDLKTCVPLKVLGLKNQNTQQKPPTERQAIRINKKLHLCMTTGQNQTQTTLWEMGSYPMSLMLPLTLLWICSIVNDNEDKINLYIIQNI